MAASTASAGVVGDDNGVSARPPVASDQVLQADDGDAALQGVADLRKGAVAAVDGDDGLGRPDDGHVAGRAEAGDDGDADIRVGGAAVVAGEDADGQAAFGGGAAAGGLHDAAQPPAHQDRPAPGDLTADLFGQASYLVRNLSATDNADKNKSVFQENSSLGDIKNYNTYI